MALQNDEKFEEELTCYFKINKRNLTNEHFNGLLLSKVYNF